MQSRSRTQFGGLAQTKRRAVPSRRVLARVHDYGVPITTASDAHHVDDISWRIADLTAMALAAGYTEVTAFWGRKRTGTADLILTTVASAILRCWVRHLDAAPVTSTIRADAPSKAITFKVPQLTGSDPPSCPTSADLSQQSGC